MFSSLLPGIATGGISRSSPTSFESLFAQLKWIDRNNIAQVALDLVDPSGRPKAGEVAATMEPSQLWDLIGGLDGLETMERNSEVLIALAFYVQQWYPEALPIAERLRLDARELKWHVARLRGAAQKGNLQISFPFYAQRAVVTYYLMTRRVLELYEAAKLLHACRFTARALGASLPAISGIFQGATRMATTMTRPMHSISVLYFHLWLEAGDRGWGIRVNQSEFLSSSHHPQT